MFGYLTADRSRLTPEQDQRYRAAYCGLCRKLRSRHGRLAGLTLNYDLCFLILLLQSLYEAEERAGQNTCAVHPREPRDWWDCRYTDYAADLNIALSYLKLRDDWNDDGALIGLAGAAALKGAYRRIRDALPRQCEAMERSMEALDALERDRVEDPDAAAETFANLMAEVFVCSEDRWSTALRSFGASLGRFLYLVDAAVDLDRDSIRGSYNPFRRYYGLTDNRERFYDILRMVMGECLYWFDRLPLVTDADLLKNILCFGLWSEFDRKYEKTGEEKNGVQSLSGTGRIS